MKGKLTTTILALGGGTWIATEVIRPSILQGALLGLGALVAASASTSLGRRLMFGAARQGIEKAEQAEAAQERHPAGTQLPPANDPYALPSARAEEVLRAFQMGADAAQERVRVQPASVRRLER